MSHPTHHAASPHLVSRASRSIGFLCALSLATASTLHAQQASLTTDSTDHPPASQNNEEEILLLDMFVVSAGGAPGQTKMETSVSVSTITAAQLEISIPRVSSELLRNIPGIRVESSSGEGNTNISARGLPLSAGGAKYLQIQEDGAPVLEMGDYDFGTAETWLRTDSNLATVEAIRGGAAATAVSNAPGGIINFISNKGESEGGNVTVAYGLDFDNARVDLGYGGPISEDTYFYVGGFYRTGEGSKTAGFNANQGGQIKGSVTRKFGENNFVRLYFKKLDDRTHSFMPQPVNITGSTGSPHYGSVRGFDIFTGSMVTPYLTTDVAIGRPGQILVNDAHDGLHAESTAVGLELQSSLPGDWRLRDRFQAAANSGIFMVPYPAQWGPAASVVTGGGFAPADATYRVASGPGAGTAIDAASLSGGTGYLMRIHLFNTRLNSFDMTSNDVRLDKDWTFDSGKLSLGAGLYTSRQDIDMDWTWNAYMQEVLGENARLIDVIDPESGEALTHHGLAAYGVAPWWGAANTRNLDFTTDTLAPYVSLTGKFGRWTLEGSVRRDEGEMRGSSAFATDDSHQYDVDGNGVIEGPETAITAIPTRSEPINFDYSHTSYSFGANFELSGGMALFGRYSLGGRGPSDRAIRGRLATDGSGGFNGEPVDEVRQIEGGLKWSTDELIPGRIDMFTTVFFSEADENGYDFTRINQGLDPNYSNTYKSRGIEFELGYGNRGFQVRANVTFTDPEISASNDASIVGNTPQRAARLMYQLLPSYRVNKFTIGAGLIGVSKSYAGNDESLVMPAYMYVNGSIGYEIAQGLVASISVNNLFDEVGITEVNNGTLGVGVGATARSISGRTTAVSLQYRF